MLAAGWLTAVCCWVLAQLAGAALETCHSFGHDVVVGGRLRSCGGMAGVMVVVVVRHGKCAILGCLIQGLHAHCILVSSSCQRVATMAGCGVPGVFSAVAVIRKA